MDEIRLIDIKEEILSDNINEATVIRERLEGEQTYLINVMGSPGAGKTSVILNTLARLEGEYSSCVIEGDIESIVDAEKIQAAGVKAVQLRTDGACHLDAPMIEAALKTIDEPNYDFLFIENVGNLVCPAEFDTGANRKMMILSVPEGDDKVLKYPLMFTICDDLVINKVDVMDAFDFDYGKLEERVHAINPKINIFAVSSKTGEGMDAWCSHLVAERRAWLETCSGR